MESYDSPNLLNLNSLFAGKETFIVQIDRDYPPFKIDDYLICRVCFFPSTLEKPLFVIKMLSMEKWIIEPYIVETPLKTGLEAPKTEFQADMGISRDMVAVVIGFVRKW